MLKELIAGLLMTGVVGAVCYGAGESNANKQNIEQEQTHAEQVANMQAVLDEAEANLNDCRLLLAQKSLALDEKSAELEAVNNTVTILTQEKSDLSAEIESLETELETNINLTQTQKLEYENRLTELQSLLNGKSDELDQAVADKTSIQSQYDQLLAESLSYTSTIATLTEQNALLQSQLDKLNIQLILSDYHSPHVTSDPSWFEIEDGWINGASGVHDELVIPTSYSISDDGSNTPISGDDYEIGELGSMSLAYVNAKKIIVPAGLGMQEAVFDMNNYVETIMLYSYTNTWISFNDCSNLKTVVLPENFESIDSYSFTHCPSLKSIVFLCSEPPLITDPQAFEGSSIPKFYVPKGSLNAYKSSPSFAKYIDYLVEMD